MELIGKLGFSTEVLEGETREEALERSMTIVNHSIDSEIVSCITEENADKVEVLYQIAIEEGHSFAS